MVGNEDSPLLVSSETSMEVGMRVSRFELPTISVIEVPV